MKVCIAEKPSVAREIAEALGATQKKDGYIEGNGYRVSWTFGHLCTLKEPQDYSPDWKQWNVRFLPMIPPRFGIKLIDNPGYLKQFNILENLIQNAEEVINCGDAGQEGELIQRWVLQRAGCKCPVRRLWISSLTEEAIREGFRTLKDQAEYQNLYEAGLSRAIGDWILGMNATRLYTLRYGQNKQVLSIGRVQTPTLALIVNRQKEIENFKPEPYWELKTVYRETTFSSTQGKFSKKEEGEELLQKITGKLFTVTDIAIKKGKELAPRLFDLTSLQVECNRKFAFSADDTLKLIQSLYEKKVTTYPRVDTTFLSEDIYPKVPQILKGLTDYVTLAAPLLAAKIPKSKKVFDNTKVTDHHAIIPTGVTARNLTDNERKVYDLVARRFIAAFYPDCEISTTTVLGEVEEVKFKVTGKQILVPGWRAVFEKQAAGDDSTEPNDSAGEQHPAGENAVLPAFTKGESGPHKPDFAEKWTTPPKPYTEATLLRAMETAGKFVDNDDLRDALKENGIGRPSTRAAIIETLFKRNYIRKERKNLYATPTGMELIDTIREELLKSVELTGLWENKLRKIEQGVYEAPVFINELKEMVGQIVRNVLADRSSHTITIDGDSIKKASQGNKITDKPTDKKAGKSAAGMAVTGSGKTTAADNAKTAAADSGKTAAVNSVGSPIKTNSPVCPLCKKGTILHGKTAYGCSEYINGCTFRLPYETYGEGLSDGELDIIIKNYTN
ncbi:MAG: DNA topoisomerase 3 [Tannerella sp.]|jgi:DNA topoisomerase-3|nr:DNA topoisomerase 3 [Tannerella sp.]